MPALRSCWQTPLAAVALGSLVVFCAACAVRLSTRRKSARVSEHTLEVAARERSFLLHVPASHPPSPPLVVVLHGSMQTAHGMRITTGYEFERLADQYGFVVAYPQGYRRNWNDCRKAAKYPARTLDIDDVGFFAAMVERLHQTLHIDKARVFAFGYSNGGQLAYRLAFEHPELVTAIASVGAGLPTAENSDCQRRGVPVSTLLIHGTRDPINPYAGGMVALFGFRKRGTVVSARASADYFAGLAGLTAPSRQRRYNVDAGDRTWVEQLTWRADSGTEVRLCVVHGGGHVVPQPVARARRFLGKRTGAINSIEEAWSFFARQPSLPHPAAIETPPAH